MSFRKFTTVALDCDSCEDQAFADVVPDTEDGVEAAAVRMGWKASLDGKHICPKCVAETQAALEEALAQRKAKN